MSPLATTRSSRDLALTALWTCTFLLAGDLAAGRLFAVPSDPTREPSALARYFDFGRSIEGKLRAMVRERNEDCAPVALAGWLEPLDAPGAIDSLPAPAAPAGGRRRCTVYGQSFSFQAAAPLARLDSSLVLRSRGGPASPASHAYALWEADRGRVHSRIAILGVLASSVRGMDAASAATWQFEAPAPYTYPRYRLDAAGSLSGVRPAVRSIDGLRVALAERSRLRAWEAQLSRDDAWYEPLLWRASWVDRSTLLRMLRRAWAQRQGREHVRRMHGRDGFREGSEPVRVLRALVTSFTSGCRADGTLPVVLLVEDRGYAGHLSRALAGELDHLGTTWLATQEIVDSSDPANLGPDGHFRPEANERIAAALWSRIRRGLANEGSGSAVPPPAGSGPGGGGGRETAK